MPKKKDPITIDVTPTSIAVTRDDVGKNKNPKKKNRTSFKPGQVTNPKGRKPLPVKIKDLRQFAREDVVSACCEVLSMSVDKLYRLEPKIKAVDAGKGIDNELLNMSAAKFTALRFMMYAVNGSILHYNTLLAYGIGTPEKMADGLDNSFEVDETGLPELTADEKKEIKKFISSASPVSIDKINKLNEKVKK